MYVKRDTKGRIMAVSTEAGAGFDEQVDPNDEGLRTFLDQINDESAEVSDQVQQLRESDAELTRVLEDIINLLTDKGVIQFTDLPEAAQEKLLQRKSLRKHIRRLDLIADDDNEDLPL